jgi:hypothetical protein
MSLFKAVAPPEDRVQVYKKNPRYIQYRGAPIFLVGCNQGWTVSLQTQDHDYRHEFDELHKVGGNLVRITPFLPPTVDDPDRFNDQKNNYPWRREGQHYHLDLERDGGNPTFWNRLTDLVHYAYERDIIISFEFWDLYGPARGPGGNQNFQTPPGDRWSAHPFFPGNSPDLTGQDMLPAQTHMKDISYCHTVTKGQYAKALHFQEQYVRKMLDVLSPYPNVMYCMVNESSAAKAWSDYWLTFTHTYFDTVWEGAPHLAGEMPREFSFTENFTVEQMVDDPIYGFADVSQYCQGKGLREIQNVKKNLTTFYQYTEQTKQFKPLTCMKIYNRDATDVLWMRLLSGSASARYHRTLNNAGNYKPPEGVDPVALQLSCVGRVVDFLRETGFKPWEAYPDHGIVVETNGVGETLSMCIKDRRTCVLLAYCVADDVPHERSVTLSLPNGSYQFFWYSPSADMRTENKTLSVEASNTAQFDVPNGSAFVSAVLYVSPSE